MKNKKVKQMMCDIDSNKPYSIAEGRVYTWDKQEYGYKVGVGGKWFFRQQFSGVVSLC